MQYDEFFAGVHENIFAEPTRLAMDTLGVEHHRDIAHIRAVCECVGARLAPVAAALGWLPQLGDSSTYMDITKPNDGHATLDASDHETVCAFALWRHRGETLRTKVVLPPERYRPGRAPWQLEGAGIHPHANDND